MIIYLATNTINNKKYVGMTTVSLHIRRQAHINQALSNRKKYGFHRAIQKYGWENFKWEEIDNALFIEDLKEKEKHWIQIYDSFKNGYNSTLGGDGATGVSRQGEKNAKATITSEQALEILELLYIGKMTIVEIAKLKNVNKRIVEKINNGLSWSHLYQGKCPSKAGRKPLINVKRGSKNGMTLVTESQVIEIKRLLSEDVTMTEIARIMNINRSLIVNIRQGTTWSWLKTEYDDKIKHYPKYKLTEDQVREIKQLLRQGEKQTIIAKHFNVGSRAISKIATGVRWKHIQ